MWEGRVSFLNFTAGTFSFPQSIFYGGSGEKSILNRIEGENKNMFIFHLRSIGLSSTAETKDEMEGRVLLDGVVLESVPILELLTCKYKTLLVWRNAFLILDLGLHIFNAVILIDIEGDVLAGESLNEDLHTTTETKNKVESGVLLDGVVLECIAILELFSSEDQALLIWRNAFLVLDLSLDILDTVSWFDFKGNVLSNESLYKDLHLRRMK